jgi:hypothetical protein
MSEQRPVLVDVDAETLNASDDARASRPATSKTRA